MSATNATAIAATTMAAITEPARSFTFGTVDYIVFVLMLCTSASIGVYFGFFSKAKNTTDEYLMGGHRMKTIPIAISLVAMLVAILGWIRHSAIQLSGIAIMSVPSETYSYGFNYFFMVISMLVVAPTLAYVIVPVFYENSISNCYEYLEMRFNKRARQLVTATFILNAFLMLPVIIFVPALAFAQVTGINIHLINGVVCSICVFYTMLGGIKAVVWTDVVQAGIMISSVVLVGVLGTYSIGGLDKVLEYAEAGGRMNFNYSWDPRVRITVWNSFIGGALMWTGHIGLNQSCVQRIVSLPSIKHARRSLMLAGVGFILIMGFNSFIGIIMYARYHGCDPLKAGLVNKPDKMMPFFVQDIMGHIKGMPGVFISCVFSAALSTMSAMLNSMAGVVYFDYIKPFMKHYHTEERANSIMKMFIALMGAYCVVGGLIVQRFDSIMQLVVSITGMNTGAVVGIFLLGMFVPRINGKVAVTAIAFSVLTMTCIVMNGQMRFKSGAIKYTPLPTTIADCEAQNLQVIVKSLTTSASGHLATLAQQIEPPKVTTAFGSNRDFSIYEISFYWYKALGALLVWLLAIPLSYLWKSDEEEKQNPHLYSPFVRRFIMHRAPVEMEEMPLKSKLQQVDDKEADGVLKEPTTILVSEKEQNGKKLEQ